MKCVFTGLTALAAIAMAGQSAEAGVNVTAFRNQAGALVSGDTDAIPAGADEITFRVTGFTGADTAVGTGISSMTGTFTASGGTMFFQGVNATQAATRSTSADFDERESPAESFVNFPSTVGTFTRTPDSASTTSFFGGWFTAAAGERLGPLDTPTGDFFDNTVLARIYVTPGADVSFAGFYNSANTLGSVSNNQPLSFSTAVPEPGGLVLLGLSAAGLVRRRAPRSNA